MSKKKIVLGILVSRDKQSLLVIRGEDKLMGLVQGTLPDSELAHGSEFKKELIRFCKEQTGLETNVNQWIYRLTMYDNNREVRVFMRSNDDIAKVKKRGLYRMVTSRTWCSYSGQEDMKSYLSWLVQLCVQPDCILWGELELREGMVI